MKLTANRDIRQDLDSEIIECDIVEEMERVKHFFENYGDPYTFSTLDDAQEATQELLRQMLEDVFRF